LRWRGTSRRLLCLLEAVVEIVELAVLATLFEIVKVVPKIVIIVLFAGRDGAFRTRQART